MGIISEIQGDLVSNSQPISTILMKLRLLAAKLGSLPFEEWVKLESEGYPIGVDVPDYRKLPLSIIGHFDFGGGRRLDNAIIPTRIISSITKSNWEIFPFRDSAASIQTIGLEEEGLHLDLSNLIPALQGKIYKDSAIQQITGLLSQHSVKEVENSVKNRILELTIELERNIPNAEALNLSNIVRAAEATTQIFHQTINGNMTNVQSIGNSNQFQLAISQGSFSDLNESLRKAGFDDICAKTLAEKISEDDPKEGGLAKTALDWVKDRASKGIDLGIKGGIDVATKVLHEAALQYWGFK